MAENRHLPVKIRLATTISLDGEDETYELSLFGRHYRKGNTIYLTYEEVQEEGTVSTVVKIAEDEVMINRTGAVKMRMRFRLGEKLTGSHESIFVRLQLETDTKELVHEQDKDGLGGLFSLRYGLEMQGAEAGQHRMKLEYKEDLASNEYR